jgi:hypothetical protein
MFSNPKPNQANDLSSSYNPQNHNSTLFPEQNNIEVLSKSTKPVLPHTIQSPRVHPSKFKKEPNPSTPSIVCINEHHSVQLMLLPPGSKSETLNTAEQVLPLSQSQRQTINLRNSFYLKSPLNFFNDILKMNHITGNDFKSRSSFSESLIICLSRKNRPRSLNHELENNLKKLQEYCKKHFDNCTEPSVLYGLFVRLNENEEMLINEEFCRNLGCYKFSNSCDPCHEFFEEFSIGVCLHQYYLSYYNADLRRDFYSHQNRFEIGQKLLKSTFNLLNYLKVQQIFSEVSDMTKIEPLQIFFSFFSGILQNFLRSDMKDLQSRIKSTLKSARRNPSSFLID